MDCVDNCWIISPPTLPPPPPLPNFLAYLNLTIDCDLCSWAGVHFGTGETSEGNAIHLSSLLIIVGVISACFGAGIMAAILSIKKLRGFSSASTSVRHLSRKGEESNPSGSTSAAGFSASNFSENTYCDGPYNTSDKDLSNSNNIYAELHTNTQPIGNVWAPPVASPSIENCYMELTDLPIPSTDPTRTDSSSWFLESPNSSVYYSDLNLTKRQLRMTSSHPQFPTSEVKE